jgi:hypothetical protein
VLCTPWMAQASFLTKSSSEKYIHGEMRDILTASCPRTFIVAQAETRSRSLTDARIFARRISVRLGIALLASLSTPCCSQIPPCTQNWLLLQLIFQPTFISNYDAELVALLRLSLWKVGIWDSNASYGSLIQNLHYRTIRILLLQN